MLIFFVRCGFLRVYIIRLSLCARVDHLKAVNYAFCIELGVKNSREHVTSMSHRIGGLYHDRTFLI